MALNSKRIGEATAEIQGIRFGFNDGPMKIKLSGKFYHK
jgi:hypothetical protein